MRGKERFSAPERSPVATFSKNTIFPQPVKPPAQAISFSLD